MAEQVPASESRTTLMHALGDCSHMQLVYYERKGLIVRLGRGRYAILASCSNVIKHLREQAAGRAGKDGMDAVTEGARLKAAQRELTEHRLALLRGETVRVPDVAALWQEILTEIRQLALSWPGKVAFSLPTLLPRDIEEMKRIVKADLDDIASLKTTKPPLPPPPADA